jgi:hypothetical protein
MLTTFETRLRFFRVTACFVLCFAGSSLVHANPEKDPLTGRDISSGQVQNTTMETFALPLIMPAATATDSSRVQPLPPDRARFLNIQNRDENRR